MYYRIKNHIIYLPSVIAAETTWANGSFAILIKLIGENHVATVNFLSWEERDTAFDALCDALLKQEAM